MPKTYLRRLPAFFILPLLLTGSSHAQTVPTRLVPGIWTSAAELSTKPMSGTAWTSMKYVADSTCGVPRLADQDDKADTCILAKALVFARTRTERYRLDVHGALTSIVNSGTYNGRALALGRNLAAYVISADLIDLKTYDSVLHSRFRNKLLELRSTYTNDGPKTLILCHELRPNNWGTYCGASRIAVAIYVGDNTDLARAAMVLKGYLGDRTAYAGFKFGADALSWSPSSALVGINPKGATVQWGGTAYKVDGAPIDDIRRGCTFRWEPCHTGYPWEGLAGAMMQAEMLHRAGYTPYEWQDRALLRAYQYLLWLHNTTGGVWFDDGTVIGDDNWQPWIANLRYGVSLPTKTPTKRGGGKGMGYTDWTHSR